jgi:ATP-binding cassette subfamily F protein 3
LDEPTTHLDVMSQEVLQDVLTRFGGTILLVSHDRYLIDRLATHIWAIEDGELYRFKGNYTAYLADRQQRALEEAAKEAQSASETPHEERARRRSAQREARQRAERLGELEHEIEQIEETMDELTRRISRASAAQDVGRVHELGVEYQVLEKALARNMQEWERLASLEHANG